MSRPGPGTAPPGSRLLAFWRLLHPLPSLLTVAAAGAFVLIAARGFPAPGRLAYLLVVETAMQFSISAWNDYFDRHIDRGRAGKPVASGAVSPRLAAATGSALAALALALALPIGPWFWLFTAVGLAAGIAYDARLKYTALSWLPFSVAFPTLPLWAWAGAAPGGELPARLFWILPVGGVLVVGIHLADTIPDLAADSGAGVQGLAHRLGPTRALAVCWASFAVGTALTLVLWAFVPYRAEWYLPGLLAGVGLMSAGVASYFVSGARLRLMALLLEMGAMALAVGWLGGLML